MENYFNANRILKYKNYCLQKNKLPMLIIIVK